MIGRIRLKRPIFVEDPEEIQALLDQVDREFGGQWDAATVCWGSGWRVYAFVPYVCPQ